MLFLSPIESSRFSIPIFALDVNLLGLALQADLALKAPTLPGPRVQPGIERLGPTVIPPWKLDLQTKSLASQINKVRALRNFINLQSADVKRAGNDKDSRALFALFNGLTALQTLAQFAAEKTTPLASLARLDVKFQQGLAEIRDFVDNADLARLTLFFGKKSDQIVPEAGLRSRISSILGGLVQTDDALRTDVIEGLTGTESFKIRIAKGDTTDDITIDLSKISGDITLDSVVDLINQEIEAVPIGVDNAEPKFVTRFEVFTKADDFGIKVNGVLTEFLTFLPVNPEPSLVVTSVSQPLTGDRAFSTTISNLTDITGSSATKDLGTALASADSEGEVASTSASAVAVDADGSVFVVGRAQGSFGDQINTASGEDVFLTKLDGDGHVLFSRLLGASGDASAFSLVIDDNGNVIVAGQTDSRISTTDVVSGKDSFVVKFDNSGNEVFRFQLDSAATDSAMALAVDANGDIFVGGSTFGNVRSDTTFSGGEDALLFKLDGANGTLLQTQLLGGAGSEKVRALAIASDGNLLVTLVEDGHAILRKLDAADLSNELFQFDLGDLGGGTVSGMIVDGTSIFVAGLTDVATFDGGGGNVVGSLAGGLDGFVTRIDDLGGSAAANFTSFIGSAKTDRIADIEFNNGQIYVAGETAGEIGGNAKVGIRDAFVASLDATTGIIGFVEQFGESLTKSGATGLAFAPRSTVLDILGLPVGQIAPAPAEDITTQTTLLGGDFFFISINGGLKRKVIIKTGDTFDTLATRIQALSPTFIKAETKFSALGGTQLRIKAVRGAQLEILAGGRGRDALAKLGVEPQKILSLEILLNIDKDRDIFDESDLGGVFGLELDASAHIRDRKSAEFLVTMIDAALATIQRAFRSLSFNPLLVQGPTSNLNRNFGPAPPHLQSQISNFQAGLARLRAFSFDTGSGIIV